MGAETAVARRVLGRGEPAPWFVVPALNGRSDFSFNVVGGRHIVLMFFGSGTAPGAKDAFRVLMENRALFDDDKASFFGVTNDRSDVDEGRIRPLLPGIRFFLDYDQAVSRLYGAVAPGGDVMDEPQWLVIDPMVRVLGRFPLSRGAAALQLLRDAIASPTAPDWAPVAMVPHVLPPELCRRLIAFYEAQGGRDSGFMSDVDGRTVTILDAGHKKRQDCLIQEPAMRQEIVGHLQRHLLPIVERSFQFRATRIERYIVGCYDAASGGHFRPHRDNTTKGTAHRRFAVTINLNAEEYEGGNLRFPEFGERTYRAPTGGAVVFSCSLLHEATPVTSGRRYAFLPFLYDEEGAKIREANSGFLVSSAPRYKAAAS